MIPDDLWALFGSDDGPGAGWAFAVPLLVFAVPAVGLLACVVWSFFRSGREG